MGMLWMRDLVMLVIGIVVMAHGIVLLTALTERLGRASRLTIDNSARLKTHLVGIYGKLAVRSGSELIRRAAEFGI